ncbi:MAG: DUF5916 domain-containing protein [Acidobacteriota bacterium]
MKSRSIKCGNIKFKKIFFSFFLMFIFNFFINAEELIKQNIHPVNAIKITDPIKIDGILDENVWKNAPSIDDIFITYNPTDGQLFPKKTKVWVAYDSENIYFAFYCYDDETEKIKTSVTKRDNMFGDDWVGLGIDTIGNRQSLYELFVNPSGIQGDIYNTPSSGENSAPDWVWYSGGKIVKDGFTVEIKLPLKSIRYKSGENVTANILFWRRCSRLATNGAWPALDPGKGMFNSLGKVIFGKLKKQRKLEFIPSVTYGSIWDRETPDSWSEADDKGEIGISAKIGLSSTTTLDFTVNPDFSQVESDSFQVSHNRRYPIFYNEKRPFFMESGALFSLSGARSNLWHPVHTRKIVDPDWGARITGSTGKLTYGGLVASDAWPGRIIEDEENFYLGKEAVYSVGRLKYGIGGDKYIGVLYSGRELGDYHNRTLAFDSTLRFGKSHSLRANFILTGTNDPENNNSYSGSAFSARYGYSTAKLYTGFEIERFDKNFRMDTAFYRRTGITRAEYILIPIFTIKSEKYKWIKSVKPVLVTSYVHDHITGLNDEYLNIGVIFDFLKEGYLTLAWDIVENEGWEGKVFKKNAFWGHGGVQLLKWLRVWTSFNYGSSIYYDEEDPFLGKRLRFDYGFKLQPDPSVSLVFSHEYTDFNRKDNGEDVYDYHIFYNRTSYQPNKHLRFRALVQYDSYLDVIMSDILASCEFVPGTVFHIGYGSLSEKLEWDPRERQWLSDTDQRKFYQKTRSFFIKISYRLQL